MMNDKIRWFLMIPAVLLSVVITAICLGFLAASLERFYTSQNIAFYMAFAAICLVSAWLLTVYFIAPKKKYYSVWVFYVLGSIVSFSIFCFIYDISVNEKDKTAIVFFITSIIYGFLLCLRIQNKWSIREFINREIKTTHL